MSEYHLPKIMPPVCEMVQIIETYGTLEFKEEDDNSLCRFNYMNTTIPAYVPYLCACGYGSDPYDSSAETPLEDIYRYLFSEVCDMVDIIENE